MEVSDPSDDVVLAQSLLILSALPHESANFAIGDQPYRGVDEYKRVEMGLLPHLGSVDDLSCLQAADAFILAQAHAWTSAELTYTATQSTKQALTQWYAPAQWLDVLATIQDELRPLRRDVLRAYPRLNPAKTRIGAH